MGKTRAKKRSSFRYRPTGLPSVKEAQNDAQENAGTIGAKTFPLVEKVGIRVKLRYIQTCIKRITSGNTVVWALDWESLQNRLL